MRFGRVCIMHDELGSPFRVPPKRISAASSPPSNMRPLGPALPRSPTTQHVDESAHEDEVNDVAADGEADATGHDTFAVVSGRPNGCKCRASRCSKMYCECFASGRYCSSLCACSGCENVAGNEHSLARIRRGIRRRNPEAFTAKIDQRAGIRKHARGCRCTQSKCLKRYCECFRAGMSCTADCECRDCHNGRHATSVLPMLAAPEFDVDVGVMNALSDYLGRI